MRIRNEHLKAFEREQVERFIDRLTVLVKQQNAGIPPGVDDASLRAMVAYGVRRARSHKLTWESSIGKFVALMFAIGPSFDEYVPVRTILTDATVTPNDRVAALFRRMTSEQWAGAVRRYDLAAWFSPIKEA